MPPSDSRKIVIITVSHGAFFINPLKSSMRSPTMPCLRSAMMQPNTPRFMIV